MDLLFQPLNSSSLQSLVEQALITATSMIQERWSQEYTYHNLQHTLEVVRHADQLALDLTMDELQRAQLLCAAAFHDSGYYDDPNDHENIGARYAANFLETQEARPEMIRQICTLIQATALHAEPMNPQQEVLKDADLHYLAQSNFEARAEDLRQEWAATKTLTFSEEAWLAQNIRFLENHRYRSQAGIERYENHKHENLQRLRQRAS